MDRQLLIMGIDPGTTRAYALLNLDGTVIQIDSSKQLDFNSLVRKATAYGKILVVGCDKKKIPEFVQKFAIKAGARVVSPEHDMLVAEKQQLTNDISFNNKHEMDALASAIIAYNEISPVLKRTMRFIKKNQAEKFRSQLVEAAVKDGENLRLLLTQLTKKPRKIVKAKPLRQKPASPQKSLIKKQGRHIALLQNKIAKLESRLLDVRTTNQRLTKKLNRNRSRREMLDLIQVKEKNIKNLLGQMHVKDSTIAEMNERITLLYTLLSLTGDHLPIKKMKTLGYAELQKMQPLLNLHSRDILLVENPNEISKRTVAFLQGRVSVILHGKPVSKKLDRELPFIFISKDKCDIIEEEHFGVLPKEQLSKHLDSKMLFNKIVREYKEERA